MSAATGILEAVPLNPAGLRPIVGRDQDLDRLISAAGIAPSGGPETLGGLVVLSGDAGMGKTRLIAELAERAGDHGWRVVVGHCLGEAGSTLPYLPFVELLGRLLSDDGPEAGRIQGHSLQYAGGRRHAADPRSGCVAVAGVHRFCGVAAHREPAANHLGTAGGPRGGAAALEPGLGLGLDELDVSVERHDGDLLVKWFLLVSMNLLG